MRKKIDLCFVGAGFQASTNIYPSVIEADINIKAIATRDKKNLKKHCVDFEVKEKLMIM